MNKQYQLHFILKNKNLLWVTIHRFSSQIDIPDLPGRGLYKGNKVTGISIKWNSQSDEIISWLSIGNYRLSLDYELGICYFIIKIFIGDIKYV